MLELRTLGELTLIQAGQRIRLATRKQYALLVYLAAHAGRTLRRDQLASLLWGESPEPRARHSLSQSLYGLRRRVPDLKIQVEGDEIELGTDAIHADFVAFTVAVTEGRYPDAVELYRGDFLQSFWISDAPAFEEWQESERQIFRQRAMHAMSHMLKEADETGQWLDVEEIASRLLQLDPYLEDVHSARIRAIAASGDLGRARREWERIRDLFSNEVGSIPESLAQSVEAFLQEPATADDPRLDSDDPSAATRFVGRSESFKRLREEWRHVKAGRGRVVIVSGEAGIGKTRLCRHFVRLAAIQGARCFQGRCYSTERQIPFSGIVDAIASGLRSEDLEQLHPRWCAALSEILPDIYSDSQTGAPPTDHEEARRRLFEAFVQLLREIGTGSPVVLLLDDFQWADDSTIAIVHHLGRRLADTPILIVIALRREEIASNTVLRRFVSGQSHTKGYVAIHLSEMTAAESRMLISAFCEKNALSIPQAFQDQLLDRIGGHPFFIIEFLRAFMDDHTVLTRGINLPKKGAPNGLPSSVVDFLEARFAELEPSEVQLMAALAVLGKGAGIDILCCVAGFSDVDAVHAITSLIHRGILVEDGDEIAFTHDLLREAAYRWIGGYRRRILHERAADVLVSTTGTSPGTLAVHYDLAGNRERAFEHALVAATVSEKMHSIAEAKYYLTMALANAQDQQQSVTVQERLVHILYRSGHHAEADMYLSKLEAHYREVSNEKGILLAAVNRTAAAFQRGTLPSDECVRRLQSCLAMAERIGDAEITCDILRKLSNAAHSISMRNTVLDAATKLLSLTREIESRSDVVRNMTVAAYSMYVYKSVSEGLHIIYDAEQIANQSDDPIVNIMVLRARAVGRMYAGQLPLARADFLKAAELVQRTESYTNILNVLSVGALIETECGNWDAAEHLFERVARLASEKHATFELAVCQANQLIMLYERASHIEIGPVAEQIMNYNQTISIWWCDVTAWSILGLCAIDRGDFGEAGRCRREVTLRYVGDDIWAVDMSYVETFLARYVAHNGEPRMALERLDRAIAAYEDRDILCRSRLQLERARILIDLDPAEAKRQAEEVRVRAVQMEAKPLIDKADAILARLVA